MSKRYNCAVIGGGAAGFFGALACAEKNPLANVVLFEKNRQTLAKVRISGGGRCNVTHACFDPNLLIRNYPRGSKALLGPFHRFQPKDTIEWFEKRGVKLKVEEDGRMFPITDQSETIINCLTQEAKRLHVEVKTEVGIEKILKDKNVFEILFSNGTTFVADRLLLTTGSHPAPQQWVKDLGHTLVPQVPSLFTFNIPNFLLKELSGISVDPVEIKMVNSGLVQSGPLLITHWGFSGPAILKLSAWGARELHNRGYQEELKINWIPKLSLDQSREDLYGWRLSNARKQIQSDNPFGLPRQLWKTLILKASLSPESKWNQLPNTSLNKLLFVLREDRYDMEGKSTYKQEFVTCGGVNLDEVNFKSMESRVCPHLYFAGEILDIDGITGGFNFQNAWTTSWIAGQAMAEG